MKDCSLLDERDVFLPERIRETSKTDYGRVMVVGGSAGYSGAPRMAAQAALRVGAGLVSVAVPDPIYTIVAGSMMESMVFPFNADDLGCFSSDAISEIIHRSSRCDVLILGPGLGRSEGCIKLVDALLHSFTGSMVLDADALFAVSALGVGILRNIKENAVITPHHGEFYRLTGEDPSLEPSKKSLAFAKEYGVATVLKGPDTYIAFPDGKLYRSSRGNPGMATGGSGDVLAGMIGGFMGQIPFRNAIINGVYIHGFAGDQCASELTEYSLLPTDIIQRIPTVLKQLISNERSNEENE